jgi:hypothetical protein
MSLLALELPAAERGPPGEGEAHLRRLLDAGLRAHPELAAQSGWERRAAAAWRELREAAPLVSRQERGY